MPARLVLIVILVAGVLLLLRWFARTPPAQLAKALKRAAVVAGLALLVLLAVTGRMHWLFAAAGAGAVAVQRLLTVWQLGAALKRILGMAQGQGMGRGPTGGRSSTIETRFLRMSLDHDTGAMDGTVLEGTYRGKLLSELELEPLVELLADCRAADPQSAAVLEAYLDRMHSDSWREAYGQGAERPNAASASGGPMTREEAYSILGLEAEATEEDIRTAHRRLMQKLHPDRGGSDYLAAKINQAKDLLLGR